MKHIRIEPNNFYVYSKQTHSQLGRFIRPLNGSQWWLFSPGQVTIIAEELIEIGHELNKLNIHQRVKVNV